MSTDPRNYKYDNDLLKDRIILVTGASDGIGRALALEAARLGARVILHGRNTAKLEKVYDEIVDIDGTERPSIAVLDLESANADGYTSLAASIESEFGHLDGLVHNASILGERYSIEQYDAVLWQKVMHVNVTATFALTQVLLPLLKQSRDASVIFTSSGVGRTGRAFWGAYSASKFGLRGLLWGLRDELSDKGVQVSGRTEQENVSIIVGQPQERCLAAVDIGRSVEEFIVLVLVNPRFAPVMAVGDAAIAWAHVCA